MILNLHKNVNCQIMKKDGEVTVRAGDGTKVSSYSVSGNSAKTNANVVAYSDECVPLFNGKLLLRLRNTLTVVSAS